MKQRIPHRSSLIIKNPADIGVHSDDVVIFPVLWEKLSLHRLSRPKLIPHNFTNLSITLSDRVIVTTRVVHGKNMIRTAHFNEDPWANGMPSVRVPTFEGWQDFSSVQDNVCLGTVSEIRIMARGTGMSQQKPTIIWFELTKIRPIRLHYEYEYVRFGDVITEISRRSFKNEPVDMHRRTFSTDGIPRYILGRIPYPKPGGRDARLLASYLAKRHLAKRAPEDCLSRIRNVFGNH